MRFKLFIAFISTFYCGSISGMQVTGEFTAAYLAANPPGDIQLVVQDYARYHHMSKLTQLAYPCRADKRKFSIQIDVTSPFIYFRIDNLVSGKKSLMQDWYIIPADGRVHLLIDTSGIRFTGKDAPALECQYQFYETGRPSWNKVSSGDSDYLTYIYHSLNIANDAVNHLIGSYHTGGQDKIWNIIRRNALNVNFIKYLYALRNAYDGYLQKRSALEKPDFKLFMDSIHAVTNRFSNHEALYSCNLPDLFLQKAVTAAVLSHKSEAGMEIEMLKLDVFNSIRHQQNTALRDRMLINFFFKPTYQYGRDPVFVKTAIKLASSQTALSLLKELIVTIDKGKPVFDFRLTDLKGDTVSPADFKGKLVVMHFWFNGCGGCALLKKSMAPVEEKYRNISNVLFVAVNVDESRIKWMDGIEKGIYTSPTEMNLTTAGQNHPLLQYYYFTSYPSMLIFDSDGNLLSSNPPRPDNANDLKLFTRLISDNLH